MPITPDIKAGASAPAVSAAEPPTSIHSAAAYESELRARYAKHWASSDYTEWAINFLLLQKLASDCTDPATKSQLILRSLAYMYTFSHQCGMEESLHWQGAPLNEGLTSYHRNHISNLSLKSDEALNEFAAREAGHPPHDKTASYLAVSSPRAQRAISRQMTDPGKILGVIAAPNLGLPLPRAAREPGSILALTGHPQDENFHMSLVHSGYAANPERAIESIVASCTALEALRKCCANLHVRSFVEHGLVAQAQMHSLVADSDAPSWKSIASCESARLVGSASQVPNVAPCIEFVGAVTLANIRGLEHIAPTLDALARDPAQRVLLSHVRKRIQTNLARAATHIGSTSAFINDLRLIHEDIATILSAMQPYERRDLDLHMPDAGEIRPVYGTRNSGLNLFHAILNASEEIASCKTMPQVATQANSYYESVFALADSKQYDKLAPMIGSDIPASIASLKSSLNGKKLDVFVGQFHDNISMNLHAYHPQNLQEQVDAILKSGLASDRFTIAVDTTIGRQDAPELRALIASLSSRIESGKINLLVFRSGLKFDLAGMDNSSVALVTTYNNKDGYWTKFNESIASPHAMQGTDFQLHTHIQKHSADAINEYRSAIARQHRGMMRLLPASMITSPETGLAPGAVQVLSNDDPDMVFMDLRPSPELSAVGGHAGDIARSIAQVATRLGMDMISRPSFGHAHTTIAPIDATRHRVTLGLEDAATMQMLSDVFSAANDVGLQAVREGDPQKTRDLFSDSRAVMNAYLKASAPAKASGRR